MRTFLLESCENMYFTDFLVTSLIGRILYTQPGFLDENSLDFTHLNSRVFVHNINNIYKPVWGKRFFSHGCWGGSDYYWKHLGFAWYGIKSAIETQKDRNNTKFDH